jgi:hypothetical protein
MKIPYNARDFLSPKYSSINGSNILDCSWEEILWAAITVGREHLRQILKHGRYSYLEIIYRAAIVLANLKTNNLNPHLIIKSQAYVGLDPSEKSAISYFIGLVSAKLFAEKLLNVSWLIHVDLYNGKVIYLFGEHPDLIGLSKSKEWVVIEAKGRSNDFDSRALDKAKQQATSLWKISGQKPILKIALESYFSKDVLQVVLQDPDEKESEGLGQGFQIELSPTDFIRDYYRPFIDLIDHADWVSLTYGNRIYQSVDIPEIDARVGIEEETLGTIRTDPARLFRTGESSIGTRHFNDSEHENAFIGLDGILVAVGPSWYSQSSP